MDIGKLLLIGGGAWVLYEVFFANSSSATPTSTTPAAATSAAAPQPTATPSTAAMSLSLSSTTAAQVQSAASQALGSKFTGMLNYDQWNYYYTQVTGISAPDPSLIPGVNRASLVSFSTWAATLGASAPAGGYVSTPVTTHVSQPNYAVPVIPHRTTLAASRGITGLRFTR